MGANSEFASETIGILVGTVGYLTLFIIPMARTG
jgi:hypothetical protein